MEQPTFRIRAIAYAEDGCYVVVSLLNSSVSRQFKLCTYCYRARWLKNFAEPDLDMIWQLARREYGVAGWRQLLCHLLVKFYSIRRALRSWEDESKAAVTGMADDFEDW